MNILKRQKRDLELTQYLCIITGYRKSGRPIYVTMEAAGKKFDLSPTHVAKIKAKLIGRDIEGVRRIKDEYLSPTQ